MKRKPSEPELPCPIPDFGDLDFLIATNTILQNAKKELILFLRRDG